MAAVAVAPATTATVVDVPARAKASLGMELVISGISVASATGFTNPLDVIKTRLQLQSAAPGTQRAGLVRTGVNIVREEGVLGLWKGLPPAVARGLTYGGLRLGLYSPCKEVLSRVMGDAPGAAQGAGEQGVGLKVAAGTLSGALAAGLTNPTELVKTRLQARDCTTNSTWAVTQQVVRESGVAGLWRGAVPSMGRAGLLTATQCATYDEVKHRLIALGASDSTPTHVAASGITGLVTTTITSPADVIKTRMFVSAGGSRRSIMQVASDIVAADGLMGFMKGWSANYARLGPQIMLTFLFSEGLRRALGLQAL